MIHEKKITTSLQNQFIRLTKLKSKCCRDGGSKRNRCRGWYTSTYGQSVLPRGHWAVTLRDGLQKEWYFNGKRFHFRDSAFFKISEITK